MCIIIFHGLYILKWGLRTDKSCKNPTRLRFATHDPDCYICDNFDSLPIIVPDAKYWESQAKEAERRRNISLLPAGNSSSLNIYRNAITIANTSDEKRPAYEFKDGEKHPFLVVVVGYCNARGMTKERCEQLTVRFFASLTHITVDDLLAPINSVYSTYSKQFNAYPIDPPPVIPIRIKRWLLDKFDKQLLRNKIHLYVRRCLHGPEHHTLKVSSPLLVFTMHLAIPQYTYTCDECFDQELSNDACADVFQPGTLIADSNGDRIFIDKTHKYPKIWDECN